MGVIVSEMGTYANHLEKACEEYRIPIFMDHKKSILLNAFVEYLRSLLAMEEENFSYESVFSLFADRYVRIYEGRSGSHGKLCDCTGIAWI